ncbi:MAG: 30S ribosomal protein THX [Bacteroidales bacterium]|jgi:ribosomal small subunit protein bTHX|nr:30S ribosomal protein THX [Bacteroidales bacterium]
MGKGDKKTKRGKLVVGSYGVRRPKRRKNAIPVFENQEKESEQKIETAAKKASVKKEIKSKAEKKTAAKSSKKGKEEKSE